MSLKLMYITNDPEIALIAEDSGVDRIFIDMEYIGKKERQGGMDTVQSNHTIQDIINVRSVIKKSELLVRCNPIHDMSKEFTSSEDEINAIIEAGADIIMLPFFKSKLEVQKFVDFVSGRVKTMLLFETPESIAVIDDILSISGIDEVFIGLNDLSIGYKKKFMFELLSDGTVENICFKFKHKKIPYGFGGIAAIGTGTLPAEAILKEHYRLGSTRVILSRSFCNYEKISDTNAVKDIFERGVRTMRAFEDEIEVHSRYFDNNTAYIKSCVNLIVENK